VTDALTAEIAALRRLSRQQLKDRWRATFKAAPPAAFTPDLLARGLAWRLQERALGGHSTSARSALKCADAQTALRRSALRPGNRLVRRWRGRTYVVEVHQQGFAFEGQQFGSLSEVARKITGTRWSGPRFFRLPQ
jgi:hypothetical protein